MSGAVNDLAMSPQHEALRADLANEQKKRKRILDESKQSGAMSASFISLMSANGNQY